MKDVKNKSPKSDVVVIDFTDRIKQIEHDLQPLFFTGDASDARNRRLTKKRTTVFAALWGRVAKANRSKLPKLNDNLRAYVIRAALQSATERKHTTDSEGMANAVCTLYLTTRLLELSAMWAQNSNN